MKKPEILAPAGSIEGLKAAIAAGCDAVYMGGSQFGARAYADNPEQEEMINAIAYCHLHQVKIYMTVNTLLKENERKEKLFSFLKPYYEAGLDAVIVQDVGVAAMISECFPSLEIHASTQMALTMGRGLDWLKAYHVTRIVPARELSLRELKQMREDTDMEMEVFVHGALCYCYSGQCLFSSMQGGRSGNRGRCAQPCRMPYRLQNIKTDAGPYILSPKELCNLRYIGELIEAGVDSFKIEGRMKRPEYTAFVTGIYRKYVDYYCEMGKETYRKYLESHQWEWEEDMRKLAELYNRAGFTQGYLEGKTGELTGRTPGEQGDMLSDIRPKHGGVCVGRVLSVGKREVVYQAVREILPQDVVEFRDSRGRQIYEYTLGKRVDKGEKVTARYQRGCVIHPNDLVYRTKDAALLDEIREKYLRERDQVPVTGEFTADVGKAATLKISCGDVTVKMEGDVCEHAKNQSATEESVRKTLCQTGNSSFYFRDLEIRLGTDIFLSVGSLKKLRREAFAEIEEQYRIRYVRKDAVFPADDCPEDAGEEEKICKKSVSVMTMEQLRLAVSVKGIQRVYLCTELLSSKQIFLAYQQIESAGKEPWLVFPRVFRKAVWEQFDREYHKQESFLKLCWRGFLVKNHESIAFLKEIMGISMDRIALDYLMYIMNEGSDSFWKKEGCAHVTMPVELTGEELGKMNFKNRTELVVYGKLPLMVSAQCIRKNSQGCEAGCENNSEIHFINRKQKEFIAVNYCKYCYNVIYQQEGMYLPQEVWSSFVRPDYVRYDFSVESQEQMKEILDQTRVTNTNTGHFFRGIE